MTKETRTALLIALGGLVVGLVLGLLIPTGGSSPDVVDAISDPDATVVEIRGERYVITPEAAETAGYIPAPSYRVVAKEEADALAQGMTPSEVEALFPDVPLVYSTYIHQPDAMIEGYSSLLGVIGLAPEGQIAVSFRDGTLDSWRWQESPNRWTFVQHPSNKIVQAIKEGDAGDWPYGPGSVSN
jgi:hypothetical protein